MATRMGPPFSSARFAEFAKYMGFHHHRCLPEWARAERAETVMKSLTLILQSCILDGLSMEQEVHKFLRNYRASPHPSTGKSPASLMFNGRTYRTRLPTPVNKTLLIDEEEVRAADVRAKEVMKKHADSKRGVVDHCLKVGDTVLHRQRRSRKGDTYYSPIPHQVTKVKGVAVTASSNEGHVITRHQDCFKKVTDSLVGRHPVGSDGQAPRPGIGAFFRSQMENVPETSPTEELPQTGHH